MCSPVPSFSHGRGNQDDQTRSLPMDHTHPEAMTNLRTRAERRSRFLSSPSDSASDMPPLEVSRDFDPSRVRGHAATFRSQMNNRDTQGLNVSRGPPPKMVVKRMLKAGEPLFWHHLKKAGEISGVIEGVNSADGYEWDEEWDDGGCR